jgi:hypothetical protein
LTFTVVCADANGAAEASISVPNVLALEGMPFYWQAGFRADQRLSGLEATTILRL